MKKRSLIVSFAAVFVASFVVAEGASADILPSVQRFSCPLGSSSICKYEPKSGGDGFGPGNLYAHASIQQFSEAIKTAGYVLTINRLPSPPKEETGFRSLELSLTEGQSGIGLRNSHAIFFFEYSDNTTQAYKKTFIGRFTPVGDDFKKVKFTSTDFPDYKNFKTSQANLKKVIVYLEALAGVDAYFGDCKIVTGDDIAGVKAFDFNSAPCPVVPEQF